MELLELFWSFLKIGFTSFGGATMVPLVNAEMLAHGWMTAAEVADIVAIAEMTPGPLGTNCATFAGMRVAGIAGALVANLGVLVPSFTLTVLVGMFVNKFKESRLMASALTGVRPVSMGLLIVVMITMGMENYVSWQTVAIGGVIALLLLKFKLSVPIAMLIAAALGLLIVR
ncbi:MAG: chromate transporter [Christensenellales bacterium]